MNRRGVVIAGVGAAAAAAGAGLWWARQPAAGASAPSSGTIDSAIWNLAMQNPQGGTLRLADYRGRWLLVNFWATWCPPCIREMPILESFYKANVGKNWQLVGIAADQAEAVNAFLTRQPVSYPVALAGFGGIELSRQLGNLAGGLPFTVVFTPDGKVAHRHIGEVKADVLASWAREGS
jgi:thiol-disulfide isomerase/thioredoxin